jgi:Ni,Fe-hydrogenase III small subunit/formate hydrogenlyase subunit 6/NADH:ubiquinone oxidoreductase subunit I
MLDILRARWLQGYRTMAYPDGPPPEMPGRFTGLPTVDAVRCADGCRTCEEVCPTRAIKAGGAGRPVCLDLGRCIFCLACRDACPQRAIEFTRNHRLSAVKRDALVVSGCAEKAPGSETGSAGGEAAEPRAEMLRKLFGRSLKLREVSAGGCNACEADTNVLNTLAWDLGRFGIQFVASPRHADGLLITGPVPENMREALRKTYDAVPAPKLVIAVGSCAIAGGPYVGHPEAHDGAAAVVPVDLFIPGCPPHPLTILDGLLSFLGKMPLDLASGFSNNPPPKPVR